MSSGVENTSTNDPTPRNVEPKNVGAAAPAPENAGGAGDEQHKTIDESSAKTANKPSSGEPGAEEGATGKESADDTAPEGGYPPQSHAGKVGYGPDYNQGGGIGDILTGKVDQLKGKLTHKPELVELGKKIETGELAREKRQKDQEEEDAKSNPFQNPDEKKAEGGKKDDAESDEPSKKDQIEQEAKEKKDK